MYETEYIQDKGTHKIIGDFHIQTSHQIKTRRPDVVLIKKNQIT